MGSQEIHVAEILNSDERHVHQGLITANHSGGSDPAVSDVSTNWHVSTLDRRRLAYDTWLRTAARTRS
jgi:hypothetical protein